VTCSYFLSENESCLQIVGTVSRPKNLFDHQDLLSGNVDGGNPECFTDSCKDHLRLRRLFVGEKSTICNKVDAFTLENDILELWVSMSCMFIGASSNKLC